MISSLFFQCILSFLSQMLYIYKQVIRASSIKPVPRSIALETVVVAPPCATLAGRRE